MNVKEIVLKELDRLEADGLCNKPLGCWCRMPNCPGCENMLYCVAAKKIILTKPNLYGGKPGDEWLVPMDCDG